MKTTPLELSRRKLGLTDLEHADLFGVSISTYYSWKTKDVSQFVALPPWIYQANRAYMLLKGKDIARLSKTSPKRHRQGYTKKCPRPGTRANKPRRPS